MLADLSGKPAEPLPPVADRKFLEIDVDNFDDAHEGDEAARRVPGAATRSPARATSTSTSPSRAWTTSRRPRWRARSTRLNKLLEARQQLANLHHLHGRQERRRGTDRPRCSRIRRCCRRWPRRRSPQARGPVAGPSHCTGEAPMAERNKPQQRSSRRSAGRQRLRVAAEEGVQAEDRPGQGGGREGGAHARRAGAVADDADQRRRRASRSRR
ncbi:MAG: type VI secretion system contractile sheath small subunit [Desulfobacterales bacterium]|nr:type VI secretion system contractile sheath small subunit [Desulfobacterales bacterium]